MTLTTMMMVRVAKIAAPLVFSAFVASGCSTESTTGDKKGDDLTPDRVLVLEQDSNCDAQDLATVRSARVSGASIIVELSYNVACGEAADISACTTGNVTDYAHDISELRINIKNKAPTGSCVGEVPAVVSIDLLSTLGPLEALVNVNDTIAYYGNSAEYQHSTVLKEEIEPRLLDVIFLRESESTPAWSDGGEYLADRRASATEAQNAFGDDVVARLDTEIFEGTTFGDDPNKIKLELKGMSISEGQSFMDGLTAFHDSLDPVRGWSIIVGALAANLRHLRVYRAGPVGEQTGFFAYIIAGQTSDGKLVGVLMHAFENCLATGSCG